MLYTVSLYASLIIFLIGLLYKISTWFRHYIGPDTGGLKPTGRVTANLKGMLSVLFSRKIGVIIKIFVLDILLQLRTREESRFRWIMHLCIYWGFMGLLLMHALEKFVTAKLFSEYASTVNPYLFLRNFFFVVVIVGLCMAVYRRRIMKVPRLISGIMDRYTIMILAVIMVSGVLLEGSKIISYRNYSVMVEDYGDTDDPEELKSLESYWVKEFGVVSPNLKGPFTEDALEAGRELHETSCAACHSKPQWALLSYGVSGIMTPFALIADKAGLPGILLAIHFLACFVGLAYLPFSKMFHMFTGPLSLLANGVMDAERSDPANIATRQIMELDACTHCGTCSTQCLVGICFEEIPNRNILPSEKLQTVRALTAGKKLTQGELKALLEGLYLCTNCSRCTVVCPVGINLQDLWFNVREALLQRGYPELLIMSPLSLYRGLKRSKTDPEYYQRPVQAAMEAISNVFKSIQDTDRVISLKDIDRRFKKRLGVSIQGNTFSYCFTCTTCSTSCPVVRNYENPPEALDLVPHQIIHAAALGVTDMIFNARMLWSCLGCYQCQENCPQGVQVADILYELKSMAMGRVRAENPGREEEKTP